MHNPDELDKDTAKSSWLCTVKVFVPDLINHDDKDADPDPATIAMELINEENGFGAFCEWPDHYQILNFVPYSEAAWKDTVQTKLKRDLALIRSFINRATRNVDGLGFASDALEALEREYTAMEAELEAYGRRSKAETT